MQARVYRASVLPWLRDRSRRLATLALFALMLQFIGAFGHSHLAHGGRTSALFSAWAVPISLTNASTNASANPDFATMEVRASVEKATPSHGIDGDAVCALCLAGHLVASAMTPAAPTLALPIAYLLLGPPQVDRFHIDPGVPTAFWSRGPPLS